VPCRLAGRLLAQRMSDGWGQTQGWGAALGRSHPAVGREGRV